MQTPHPDTTQPVPRALSTEMRRRAGVGPSVAGVVRKAGGTPLPPRRRMINKKKMWIWKKHQERHFRRLV